MSSFKSKPTVRHNNQCKQQLQQQWYTCEHHLAGRPEHVLEHLIEQSAENASCFRPSKPMLEGCCELKSQHTEIAACAHVGYAAPQCMHGYKSLPNPHDSAIVCANANAKQNCCGYYSWVGLPLTLAMSRSTR